MSRSQVVEFGERIGIPYAWYRNRRPAYDWKSEWHDLLHELGHLAVYPQGALVEYQVARARAMDLGRCSADLLPPGLILADQVLLAAQRFYPDEYGVRCWCLDVLRLLGLHNPIEEAGYGIHPPGKRPRNAAQWIEPPPIFRGREQLAAWGIDVLGGRLRPQVEPLHLIEGAYCPVDRAGFAEEVEYNTHGN